MDLRAVCLVRAILVVLLFVLLVLSNEMSKKLFVHDRGEVGAWLLKKY